MSAERNAFTYQEASKPYQGLYYPEYSFPTEAVLVLVRPSAAGRSLKVVDIGRSSTLLNDIDID
jgi:hypothetical protein